MNRFAVVVSLLMVSRIPYPHMVNQLLGGQRSFAHVVAVVFALIPVLWKPGYFIPLLTALFVIAPPCKFLWQRFYERRAQKEPLF